MKGMINSQLPDRESPTDPQAPGSPQMTDREAPGSAPVHEQAEPPPMEQRESAGPGETDDIKPEDKQNYERFMLAAQRAIYETKLADHFVQALKSSKDPVKTLADLTYETVAEIDDKSRGLLPDELMGGAAMDVLGMVVEVAQSAGAKVDGKAIAGAAKAMLERYFRENGATDDELQGVMQNVDLDGAGAEIDKGMSGMGQEQSPAPPGIMEQPPGA